FRISDRVTGCAVMVGAEIRAQSGTAIPWGKIASDPGAVKEQSFIQHPSGGAPILAATSSVTTIPSARVLTAQILDQNFQRSLSGRIGLPVRILDRDTALAREGDPPADLRATALIDDRPASARLVEAEIYLAVYPLHDSSGRPAAVVETVLERKAIAASLSELKRSLGGLAAGVAIMAALLSLILARRLTRPLEVLTEATAQLGGGDLTTPIPRVSGRETGALSETMEEMRRR